ncbi:MAG: peptidylprolyl isomerase, partial [Ruminiclostridium sp.]|nr:peptidylprolyl isomerase [Ruminiclostridium sp.]
IYEMSMKAINDRTDEMTERYKEKGGYPFLDGGYTVFGQVVEGFDVIDKVSAVEVKENSNGEKSVPVTDIFIESVTIGTVE